MGEQGRGSWRRTFNKYIGLGTAVLGMAIVLSSFLFLRNLFAWYATIMIGLLIVLAGFLYGAHPFLTSERRYFALREEVDRFIDLVRRLNAAAVAVGTEGEFEQVKVEMLKSVERMAELAGREGEAARAGG
ncbi:MAG: hypothetical protein JSV86_15970 [Gemmatimonadota bacterium]|nr:MAG: hypothetical protein JSV86_15970 [Gemmatimonadota bacterium]